MTVPFRASSRTLAEIVVFMGTPNLLPKVYRIMSLQVNNSTKKRSMFLKKNLNKAANIVLTVPRFDKSISMSIPSASRALLSPITDVKEIKRHPHINDWEREDIEQDRKLRWKFWGFLYGFCLGTHIKLNTYLK